MHGDYSRGHEPDRKRGRDYRRVLLQQGRPVLDSDVAALVDAVLDETRTATRTLGCAAGSPDLGFLVTPGRLVAVFAEAAAQLTAGGSVDAWLDYRHRFAGRYPALQLATDASAATVTLPALQPLSATTGPPRAALWAYVEAPETITVNGITVALSPSSPPEPVRFEFATGSATLASLQIGLPAHTQVWLFALEQDALAGEDPAFSIAPGSYIVDGLILETHGGVWPELSFPGFGWDASPPGMPPLAGLLPPAPTAGTRLVAYLETWERHISAVEDPGIREEALGGTDTTARSELIGQVKLATVSGLAADDADAAGQALAAFDAVELSGGELTIAVPPATPSTDPCALPDVAGYSGADNRLYRVEVHAGGALSALTLKWSRDNGSELFAARLNASRNLVFDAGTPLAEGDIVEVLSDVVDLGDDALAALSASGFVPAQRAVGQLSQLAGVPSPDASDEVLFKLVDPDDVGTTVALDPIFADAVKLRRWHGILAAGGSAGPHVLEDGITITLSTTGSYRAGQYWQYEARVRGENANGPWRPAPHGPERRFAPLALLAFDAPTEPLRLLAWLDERFSHPCDLDADDVAFAGGRVGSDSDTVQEALEELFERPPEIVDASCGELIIRPENDPQTVFDTIPAAGDRRICIHPGTWNLTQTVLVQGKGDLIISGAGDATRWVGAATLDSVLRFSGCGNVRVQDMTIDGGKAGAEGFGTAGSISALNCNGLDLERVNVACAEHPARRVSAVEVRSDNPVAGVPEVRVRDCHLTVGHAQVGVLVVNPATVDIEANTISCAQKPLPFPVISGDAFGHVGRRVIGGDFFVGETALANDELLVGSPDILDEFDPVGGRRRFIAHLEQWGNQFITFTSMLTLSADQWRSVFVSNPIPPFSGNQADPGVVALELRHLRDRLRSALFGPSNLSLTAPIRAALLAIGNQILAGSNFTSGEEGIVLAGRGSPIDAAFGSRVITGDTRPHARITGNRILGFVRGIHVAAGVGPTPGIAYAVTITDNLVHLRVPATAGGRHGIFVGNVHHLRVEGNTIELRTPGPSGWAQADPIDAIRVWGLLGPAIRLRYNHAVGTRRGAFAHPTNPGNASTAGWHWDVTANTHVSASAPAPDVLELS